MPKIHPKQGFSGAFPSKLYVFINLYLGLGVERNQTKKQKKKKEPKDPITLSKNNCIA